MSYDYTNLQADIAAYMHRSDLASVIPGFIALAEARINRDLRVAEMEDYGSIFSVGDSQYLLPARFLAVRELWYDKGTRSIALKSVGRHAIAARRGAQGDATVYSIVNYQLVEVAPAGPASLNILYYAAPKPLGSGSLTNPVLTSYPYLYLYASLIEAAIYTQDMTLEQGYQARYQTDLIRSNEQADNTRFGESPTMTVA
jgi:hypothetical protein